MPMHKRESLIYTVLMCFSMVLWMSMYNVALHMGTLNMEVIREGWLGFPLAYVCAMCLDWFLVSKIAKGFAFRFLVKPESSTTKKVIAVSCCMVVPMVIFMSLYGGLEACVKKRSMEYASDYLAYQYSKEFYYGTAVSASDCRSVGKKDFSDSISGWNRIIRSRKWKSCIRIPLVKSKHMC